MFIQHIIPGPAGARYPFACRDPKTHALKPAARNGSRRRMCRGCKALKLYHKCLLFHPDVRLEQLGLAPIRRRCLVCHELLLDGKKKYCHAHHPLAEEWSALGRARAKNTPCRWEGCQNLVCAQSRYNKSGMCQKHARLEYVKRKCQKPKPRAA